MLHPRSLTLQQVHMLACMPLCSGVWHYVLIVPEFSLLNLLVLHAVVNFAGEACLSCVLGHGSLNSSALLLMQLTATLTSTGHC